MSAYWLMQEARVASAIDKGPRDHDAHGLAAQAYAIPQQESCALSALLFLGPGEAF